MLLNKQGTGQEAEHLLKEGEDYTVDENGLLVFTASYHLKRGYCCGSGCRHCPYEMEANPPVESEAVTPVSKPRPSGQ